MRGLAGLGRRLGVVLGYCAPKPRVNMRANSSGAVWCGAAYVSSAPQKYCIPVCSVCGRAVGWTADQEVETGTSIRLHNRVIQVISYYPTNQFRWGFHTGGDQFLPVILAAALPYRPSGVFDREERVWKKR
ncbi:hypothetical protein RRG08_016359 [Elysia crispata]|uniref:Uncharacterized protein n=1 Tax=Elysia crispata TaxID=231223 RepID=A0AAE1DYP5_9GAST|nr:hypothetical protein RRG08_016359 [Elysia crispata]